MYTYMNNTEVQNATLSNSVNVSIGHKHYVNETLSRWRWIWLAVYIDVIEIVVNDLSF